MKLVKFIGLNSDKTIYINPDYVMAAQPVTSTANDREGVKLILAQGQETIVAGMIQEVGMKLGVGTNV